MYSHYRSKQELFRLYFKLVTDFIRFMEMLTEISGDLNFMDYSDVAKALSRWEKTRVKGKTAPPTIMAEIRKEVRSFICWQESLRAHHEGKRTALQI